MYNITLVATPLVADEANDRSAMAASRRSAPALLRGTPAVAGPCHRFGCPGDNCGQLTASISYYMRRMSILNVDIMTAHA